MCTNQFFKYLGIVILFTLYCGYASAQEPWIDSLYIIPEQPRNNDQLFLVTELVFSYSSCRRDSFESKMEQNRITINSYYQTGAGTGLCYLKDTFLLGELIAGNYTVLFNAKERAYPDTSSDSLALYVDFAQGIGNNYLPIVSIYPNPADDQVFIEMEGKGIEEHQFQVELYNYTGRRLMQINGFNKTTLDTKGLPRGIYYIHVFNDVSLLTSVHKILLY